MRRQEIFRNLEKYLKKINDIVSGIDPEAEIYLFGSVAEGRQTYSSDIDILIITNMEAGKMLMELWRHGIKDPFEIHIQSPEKLSLYQKRCKLLRINKIDN